MLGLELAKEKTSELGKSVDSKAAEQLVKCSFVDDVGGGGSLEEVLRMQGRKDSMGIYTGTLPKVLATGGFQAKALVQSKRCDDLELEALGGKFLGVGYCAKTDLLKISFSSKISKLTGKKFIP